MYLVDTAGLAESDDPVERLGIARGAEAMRAAALVALVVDGSAPPSQEDLRAASTVRGHAPHTPVLLVRNKCDLPSGAPPDAFTGLLRDCLPIQCTVSCSAVSGEGLAALEDALADLALGGETLVADQTLVENARQRQALSGAVAALATAAAGLEANLPAELVCIDLRAALDALGALTGENVGEAVLDRIFADFCLGK
jgi:tRNA modification GTPase